MNTIVSVKGQFLKSESAEACSDTCLAIVREMAAQLKASCHQVEAPQRMEFSGHHGKVKHWAFHCTVRKHRFLVSVTIYDEFSSSDLPPKPSFKEIDEFLSNPDNAERVAVLTIDSTLPFWLQLIGPSDKEEHQELCGKIDCILSSDSKYVEIKWRDKKYSK